MAFDEKKLREAVNAGREQAVIRSLAQHGITFDESLGKNRFMLAGREGMAFDAPTGIPNTPYAQAELNTVQNAGVPWQFLNWIDPKTIPVLLSPTMAAVIAGESMKGNWTLETLMFRVGETVGQWSAYGDYSMDGKADVNYNYPQRQNYLFQSFIEYGEREIARFGEAGIQLASDKQGANAVTLNKGLNAVYFYGVAPLQNYGLITDPFLPAPITPIFSWISSSSATANTIYQDIVRLVTLLTQQSNGTVQANTPMVLALSPANAQQLKQVTLYNTNSVLTLIKQNFPNIRIEEAPEYGTASGQLVQLIAEELDGVRTVECCYSVKMMASRQVALHTSISQKRTTGAWGAIWKRRFLVASMLG